MTGAQNIGEKSDNPVGINVVPLVDIIFCLCIFFMCSFHFKQLEGKIESWLPDRGGNGPPPPPSSLEDIRIIMKWNTNSGQTVMHVSARPIANYNDLKDVLSDSRKDFVKLGKTDVRAEIDAETAVPWQDVINVMDICNKAQIPKIEFAGPELSLNGSR